MGKELAPTRLLRGGSVRETEAGQWQSCGSAPGSPGGMAGLGPHLWARDTSYSGQWVLCTGVSPAPIPSLPHCSPKTWGQYQATNMAHFTKLEGHGLVCGSLPPCILCWRLMGGVWVPAPRNPLCPRVPC